MKKVFDQLQKDHVLNEAATMASSLDEAAFVVMIVGYDRGGNHWTAEAFTSKAAGVLPVDVVRAVDGWVEGYIADRVEAGEPAPEE